MTSNESELKSLMIAGLAGDSAAHRALLERLSKHLRAFYKNRMPSYGRGDSDAADLVQEVLIAIHTRRHTYDPKDLLTPWVYAIARYKLIDYLRRNRASLANVPIEDAGELIARDDRVASESITDLGRLLAQLPLKMRRAIEYVKLEGLSVSEAALRSGMSESAVKINIHRGLQALSASISREPKL